MAFICCTPNLLIYPKIVHGDAIGCRIITFYMTRYGMLISNALIALLTLASATQLLAGPVDREECDKVKQQIRALEAKMRNGYSAAQGIRYDERMRRLKDKRYKVCR